MCIYLSGLPIYIDISVEWMLSVLLSVFFRVKCVTVKVTINRSLKTHAKIYFTSQEIPAVHDQKSTEIVVFLG